MRSDANTLLRRQLFRPSLGEQQLPITVIDPRYEEIIPDTEAIAGAVITGSHSMVTDREPWSERLADWICTAVAKSIPILGICYGHQLLAHALGGEVGYRPGGIELGTVLVNPTPLAKNDPLFAHLPNPFPAHVVHRQSVLRLPNEAVLLANSTSETCHAFRVSDVAWGVQFHPEFSSVAMAGYIQEVVGNLNTGDGNLASLSTTVLSTEDSASLLSKFAQLVEQRNAKL